MARSIFLIHVPLKGFSILFLKDTFSEMVGEPCWDFYGEGYGLCSGGARPTNILLLPLIIITIDCATYKKNVHTYPPLLNARQTLGL
jgi:hypothetical protein